jgi:putative mycofactocin binding protein MftB
VLSVHPSVAVRPEPFGALVYHYGNRKLVFLKSPGMVRLVHALDGRRTLDDALRHAEIPESAWPRHREALTSLLRSDMLLAAERVES